MDGTGREAYQADLLIKSDSIGFIGKVDPDSIKASQTIDAGGKVITPGLIDVHAHGDPLQTPEFRNFLAMGVTTIVLGQDGSSSSVGQLDEWFSEVEQARPAVNIATLSGHGSIRGKVGIGNRSPVKQEMRQMESLLVADLKSGAFGMSTGLEYVPGLYADSEELQRMAQIVGQFKGITMSHMRSEDDRKIKESLDELANQGEYSQVHASHLKVVYGKGAERAEEILQYMDSLKNKGVTISADTYPYAASFTGIGIVFPKWAKTEAEWKQAKRERPSVLRQALSRKLSQRNGPGAILFGTGPYTGKTLQEAAEQEGRSPVDLLIQMGPQAASAAHFVMNEALQDRIAIAPDIMISSDGSPTMRHPRGYGSFAKVIAKYVNRQQQISLEKAIYKMSGLPAKTLGLEKRGQLQKGNKADILIFEPSQIQDTATFADPHKLAKGFSWVMVNGEIIREDGEFTNSRNGQVLRRAMAGKSLAN